MMSKFIMDGNLQKIGTTNLKEKTRSNKRALHFNLFGNNVTFFIIKRVPVCFDFLLQFLKKSLQTVLNLCEFRWSS